jgi:uncharacterized integral membrane protein
MLAFILLSLLLLAVAVFALQNPTVVTLHFLAWQVQTSVAILTLVGTMVGAMIAGLIALAARFQRWQRTRAAAATARPPAPPPPRPTP